MSETVFKKVEYDLNALINFISLGEIGLPDLQRPFIWKNSKIRDLFDSMYKGYPVGYLLFWQSSSLNSADARTIGTDSKQKQSRLLIVDGQQRLTSLYAVIKEIPVVRNNYEKQVIKIAFNPLLEKFEVYDAAIAKDKYFISNISIFWSKENSIFRIAENYLSELNEIRKLGKDEKKRIENSIQKVHSLLSYPFTALELSADINEEDVADIFVRINSKGKSLNQADFILTLMSVFWDEGRTKLEEFCKKAKEPSKNKESPFTHFIEPKPSQLLRISVGLGFKRIRFQYIYSLLRGKDLDTGDFSEERREQQFEILKEAQKKTTNLQYWHDFMNCVRLAGFRSSGMITSENNLIFSYILYLMGRTEYRVPEFDLRNAITKWYFMSSLTKRFSSSPDTNMESDIARFRELKTADEFLAVLENACRLALTEDYWAINLPNDLATSSSRSPSLFAYDAALILLDASALFSKLKISELLDPASKGIRGPMERHHLFPKNHLKKLGISELREVNQIANKAWLEWNDNSEIKDKSPKEYFPGMASRFDEKESSKMYHWHALPNGWEEMEYQEFLNKRRELIAKVIREGYNTLAMSKTKAAPDTHLPLGNIIASGESNTSEFKSTLRMNLHTRTKDPKIELAAIKTIAGFLNSDGGLLTIGIEDEGSPIGIDNDQFKNEDSMYLHLVNLIKDRIINGATFMQFIHPRFEDYDEHRVMVIECAKANRPVYVKDANVERFYIRTGPSTTDLSASEIQKYIEQRFNSL